MKSVLIPMLFIGAVCAVAWASPVHAQTPPADAPITAEEARALQSALDTLAVTLGQLESRLANAGGVAEEAVADPPQARASLGELRGTLVAIDSTLTSRELAFLMRQRALSAGTSPEVAGEMSSVDAAGPVPGEVAGAEAGAGQEVAAVAETVPLSRRKVIQWGIPAAVVLGALGVAGYFLWRKRQGTPAPSPAAAPPSPSVPSGSQENA